MPAAPAAATATWREVLNREHLPLTIGLVFLEFMAGMQYLVVDAVMPRVARNYLPLRPNRSGIEKRRSPSRG